MSNLPFKQILEKELNRLRIKYNVSEMLTVICEEPEAGSALNVAREVLGIPEQQSLAGEVIGSTIGVYCTEDMDRALHILRHEFFEWLLYNKLVKPYDIYVESLEKMIQQLIYRQKESLIERFTELETENHQTNSKRRQK